MLKIEIPVKEVPAKQEDVYHFLADMNNLQKLMPEQVVNWKSDIDACTYTIKGMAEIGMRIAERQPASAIIIKSEGKTPFPFSLRLDIATREAGSAVGLQFEGEVNPFLQMMVEKPLKNFFALLVSNLPSQFS